MEVYKSYIDLSKYYQDNTPINLIISNIISENDDFLKKLYEMSAGYENINKNIKYLTDIIAIQYCSIRCVYDMPDLCNIKYRNYKATANFIFGEDATLLSSMIIQVDCINALLHYLNDYYPNKIENAQQFLDKILKIDDKIDILYNSSLDNMEIYKKEIINIYQELIKFLLE